MKRGMLALGILCVAVAYADAGDSAGDFMRSMSASMVQMDHGMAVAPMDGDVDHDFAAMMIPHHEGAIDMAKAELNYGRDPVMRRLAEEIIVDQHSEIEAMKLRLAKFVSRTANER